MISSFTNYLIYAEVNLYCIAHHRILDNRIDYTVQTVYTQMNMYKNDLGRVGVFALLVFDFVSPGFSTTHFNKHYIRYKVCSTILLPWARASYTLEKQQKGPRGQRHFNNCPNFCTIQPLFQTINTIFRIIFPKISAKF